MLVASRRTGTGPTWTARRRPSRPGRWWRWPAPRARVSRRHQDHVAEGRDRRDAAGVRRVHGPEERRRQPHAGETGGQPTVSMPATTTGTVAIPTAARPNPWIMSTGNRRGPNTSAASELGHLPTTAPAASAPSAMPSQCEPRPVPLMRSARPSHHRADEDVERGQPGHEEACGRTAAQIGESVGERVAPPRLLIAWEPIPRPDHEREHERDDGERHGVEQHGRRQTTHPYQDAAGRSAEQPHHAAQDLVPSQDGAEVVRVRDLADQCRARGDREPCDHSEGERRDEERRRPSYRACHATAAEHQDGGSGHVAGDEHLARVPAVGHHAPEEDQRSLREHLEPDHRAGDGRRQGVDGGPRQGDDPHGVAERRDRDPDQPGEDHRVPADGGGTAPTSSGRRCVGLVSWPHRLAREAPDQDAHGTSVGFRGSLLVDPDLAAAFGEDRLEAAVEVGGLRGRGPREAVGRAGRSAPARRRLGHLLEPLLDGADLVTEVSTSAWSATRRPGCPARSRRRSN